MKCPVRFGRYTFEGGDGQVAGALGTQTSGKGQGVPFVCTAHQNASGDVHVAEEMTGTITSTSSVSRQQIVCVADDNAKAAVDDDLCGSLKVGGGRSVNSNGQDVVGAICARDFKGVGNEYVSEGKVICQTRAISS